MYALWNVWLVTDSSAYCCFWSRIRGTDNDKSMYVHLHSPIVDINVVLNASSENRNNIQVLPTPESPINSNLKR